MEQHRKEIGGYILGISAPIQERQSAQAPLEKLNWPSTKRPRNEWPSKYYKSNVYWMWLTSRE